MGELNVKCAALKDKPEVAPNVKSPPIVIPENFAAKDLVAVPEIVPPFIVNVPFPNAFVPAAANVPAFRVNPPPKVPPAIASSPNPFFVTADVADIEKPGVKFILIPEATAIGRLIPAAPKVPPAVQVIAAPKLIPTIEATVAPVAEPALLKLRIGPPVVTNEEVYGPPEFVLQSFPLIVPLVPK